MPQPTIVVHGGAGNPRGGRIAVETPYHAGLSAALEAGYAVLAEGGRALDAVQAAVESLEDDPMFNSARGAVLNEDGVVEMDACVMDGNGVHAGAVASVIGVRHPVALARAVLDDSDHVFIAGDGALRFARERGLERMDAGWFVTERERRNWSGRRTDASEAVSLGTVGAVALDSSGNLAAATSTGGVQGKRAGRIGDSPLVGAGTYADDRVAVSATGSGEQLIRCVAGKTISSLVEHRGMPLGEACEFLLHERFATLGGEGGLIAVDAEGNVCTPFNTQVMHRGWQTRTDQPKTAIGV
ncbi:MAG: L-asparaginase / beta-aspartyl-peptidase [Thermoleophilaceae bacterium]|nr:L-asparaginase / beta-aspartyl-peptidase [Thermoleophilaceae bacterium]